MLAPDRARCATRRGVKMSTTIRFMMAAAALAGATVLFSGATEERLDIRSPAGCPAFAWPNSYGACLDDVYPAFRRAAGGGIRCRRPADGRACGVRVIRLGKIERKSSWRISR